MKNLHDNDKIYFSKSAWRYYWGLFESQYHKLILSTIGSIFQAILIIPVILLIKYAFDKIIPEKNTYLLIIAGVGIFLLRTANSLVSIWLRDIHLKIINKSVLLLRKDLLTKLYKLSRDFHTSHDPKILHTRIVVDTERLSNLGNVLVSREIPSLIISFALVVLLFFLNWKLMLIVLAMAPVLYVANRITGKMVKKRVFIFQRAFEAFSKGVYFILKYFDLTVIQSNQTNEIKKREEILHDLNHKTNKMAIIFTINAQLHEILTSITGIVIIVLGGIAVISSQMTLGDFLSFYIAASYLNKFVNTATASIPEIIAGNESLNTLYELARSDQIAPYHGKKIFDFRGNISFDHVSFQYTTVPVLENISFQLCSHETYALTGDNSAGKSTIINLILGFYRPQKGTISVDGHLYDEIDINYLRKNFGVVMQHPQLFSGTIRENIMYGNEDLGMENMLTASKLALAHDFISKLPDGYNTEIGEDGILLSGGECQRIAIARALMRQPRFLILDEPTNHLDEGSISQIMNNIENLESRPAILLVSHDENVTRFAKHIFRLENGKIEQIFPDK